MRGGWWLVCVVGEWGCVAEVGDRGEATPGRRAVPGRRQEGVRCQGDAGMACGVGATPGWRAVAGVSLDGVQVERRIGDDAVGMVGLTGAMERMEE